MTLIHAAFLWFSRPPCANQIALSQFLDLYWRSPESVMLWHKLRRSQNDDLIPPRQDIMTPIPAVFLGFMNADSEQMGGSVRTFT